MKLRYLPLLFALGLSAPVGAQGRDSVVIRNVTVHTEPGKKLEGVTVVVQGGVIRSLAKGAAIPANTRIIDGTGKVVTAGFIESASTVGMVEVGAVSATVEGRFHGNSDPVHAAFRAADGYHAASVAIPVARMGGVTAAVIAPHGALISGTGSAVKLAGRTGAEATLKGAVAMYANLGNAALRYGAGSRAMAIKRLREVLDDAKQYQKSRGAYNRNQSRRLAAERLDLEALGPVLKGRLPLVIRAHRASDILAAIAIGKEFGARIVIEGGVEAWVVAKELRAAKVAVLLDPLTNLPGNFERLRVREDMPRILRDAGVDIAISGLGSASNVRRLRQLAGNAVARGLTWDEALAAITTAPAAIFGLKRGTVARGKPADLVLWSGDPFEFSSHPEYVLIDGTRVLLESRQTRLRDKYRRLPK